MKNPPKYFKSRHQFACVFSHCLDVQPLHPEIIPFLCSRGCYVSEGSFGMNECHLLLPIFYFSLEKLWCQHYPKKCWANKHPTCVYSPPPALAELNAASSTQLIPLHYPQPGHVLQGTEIGKWLLEIAWDIPWSALSSDSEKNVLDRLMELFHTVVKSAQKKHIQFFLDLLDDSISLQ